MICKQIGKGQSAVDIQVKFVQYSTVFQDISLVVMLKQLDLIICFKEFDFGIGMIFEALQIFWIKLYTKTVKIFA